MSWINYLLIIHFNDFFIVILNFYRISVWNRKPAPSIVLYLGYFQVVTARVELYTLSNYRVSNDKMSVLLIVYLSYRFICTSFSILICDSFYLSQCIVQELVFHTTICYSPRGAKSQYHCCLTRSWKTLWLVSHSRLESFLGPLRSLTGTHGLLATSTKDLLPR